MFPDANIGIATGKDSNLIVIDVDPRHGGWEGLQSLFERAGVTFPATIEAITGSDGRHFYFQMPEADIRNSQNKLAQGVDVRANGGYVVGAPSLHASGKRYAWTQTEAVLEPLPYPFMRQLIEPERKAAREVRVSYSPSQTWQGGTIPDGSRNETMFRKVACAARARGADYNGILNELVRANFQCSPPLSERELNNIANSAAQYPISRNIFTGSASI
jgi:putative DNA primase/helicase